MMRAEPRGVNVSLTNFTETYNEPFEPEPDNTGVGMALRSLVYLYLLSIFLNVLTKYIK